MFEKIWCKIKDLENFFMKGQIVNILHLAGHVGSDSTTQYSCCRSKIIHRQCANEWPSVCFNKTLFTK